MSIRYEGQQDRMHNDCMTAVRLTLTAVSEARVKLMTSASLKRERQPPEGEAVAPAADGGVTGPPTVVAGVWRRRVGDSV